MNKTLIFSGCFLIAMLGSNYSYSGQNQTQKPKISVAKKTPAKPVATKQEVEEGKAIIAKQDCFACHKPKDKVVGPAYADIAKKYALTEANVSLLSQKVIKGGSGVWGQIPMSPHPTLSVSDSKKVIKYILSEFK